MNKKLGKYHVLEEIGRGGMAVVYRARQESLDRIVAIKELDLTRGVQDPRALERFQLEARSAASLDHPSIITVHDFWERASKAYIAMEYVDGLELKEVLALQGPVDPVTAARIGIRLCQALSYAHEKGIVHRDIKPGNVMLSAQGSVKLADFGIALVSGEADLTTTGQIIGTPSYMSPEQIRGEVLGPSSDIFSLGSVLYEMVTGAKPFTGPSDVAITHAIIRRRPVPIRKLGPGTPRRLVRVIMKCLRKKPSRRYRTMDEVAQALERILSRRAPSTGEAVAALIARARFRGSDDATIPLPPAGAVPARGRRAWVPVALTLVFILGIILFPRDPVRESVAPLPPTPPPSVPLRVHAWPWAEVFLDGRSLGFSPRAEPFPVPAGKHTLVLKNPHFGERILTIDLVQGREEQVSVDLTEGGS